MAPFSRLTIAFKALRELGPAPLALNTLYRLGLATGHYKRAIHPPAPISGLQLQPLWPLPAREELVAALGLEGRAALLAEADEIVMGRVRLFGSEPVDLQLAPPAPLAHWTDYETHRVTTPDIDIKFTWEPARFGWAFVLGRAWHISGDEKYAEAFWRYFETFQSANPPYLGPNWISGQEAGIRLMALVWAAQVFASSIHSTPERRAVLAAATAVHAARIPATLVYARAQNNNHLLTEAAALYTAGLSLPEHPGAARWRALGEQWLAWCLAHQIDAYGEYVQHSANYHRLMLQTALWVRALATKDTKGHEGARAPEVVSGISCPSWMNPENLALATHWLLSLLDPETGRVPNLGANDGAQIFPLSTRPFDDYRPVAQSAARAFLDYSLPPGPWDEMALWFGLPRDKKQLEIPRYPGDHIYASHSWGTLRAVRFKSRPSHADQLHFDLWWRGLNIAQDAGTYLYNADPPWDNRLTSTLVHNTVSVDGREQMTRAGRFLYLDWADASSKRHFETGADFVQRSSARTYAYMRLGVRHDRVVTVFNDEHWQVRDELLNAVVPGRSPASRVYRLHWLLPDWGWELKTGGEEIELCLTSPWGPVSLRLSWQPAQLEPVVSLVRAGEYLYGSGAGDPVRGWVSPTYAQKTPALSLAIEVESSENVTLTSEFEFPSS